MAIDTDFIISSNLTQYFVDKDTGLPLSGGEVRFFEDNNRSVPKPIFKLSGSPPNYSFVEVINPVPINLDGSLGDGLGNNIIPAYKTKDDNGDLQLYFAEVYSSGGVPQYTREAWPLNAVEGGGANQGDSETNLIPNGQFLLHNNILPDPESGTPANLITLPITQIAQGGWSFNRPVTSTSVDSVSFTRFTSYTNSPTGSPRFAVRIESNGSSPSDAFKDLRMRYGDVNKFASDTQKYTVFFSAKTFNSGNYDLNLNLIKNYGTGGDIEEIVNIATFTITSVQTDFIFSFDWGDNDGKLIGALDDDYCEIAFSLPSDSAVGFEATDFTFFVGDIEIENFPVTTNKDFVDRSLIPVAPNSDGFDIGLPLILTKEGMAYDSSQVGKVKASTINTPEFGELLCDGAQYRSDSVSLDGIPYRRLRNKLTPPDTFNIPVFGTGIDYVTSSTIASDSLLICSNKAQALASTADGLVPTGFTFNEVSTGFIDQSTVGSSSWQTGVNGSEYWIMSNETGSIDSDTVYNNLADGNQSVNPNPVSSEGEIVGTSVAKDLFKVSVSDLPTAGSRVKYTRPSTLRNQFWFTLDGVGSSPGGSFTFEHQVNLFSDMSASDAAYAISQAIASNQVSYIQVIGGGSIPDGSYFTFNANGQLYYIWYNLNGAGSDPVIAGGVGVGVAYVISDSPESIRNKTISAINDLYFSVPDLRGWSIKGWSNDDQTYDENFAGRFSLSNNRYNDPSINRQAYIGSYQHQSVLSHSHQAILGGGSLSTPTLSQTTSTIPTLVSPRNAGSYISDAGTGQNTIRNVYLNYVIQY